jgi:DNA-binding NtrC family response regulator
MLGGSAIPGLYSHLPGLGMKKKTPSLTGLKLLIAEDDAVIAMDYAAMLTSAGAEVVATARTAAEVVAHLQQHPIDAAIVDFVLADGNSSTLQAVLAQKHIPFVVVSGYPSVLVRESKDQHVLHKPVTADNLCTAVLAVCNRGS